MVKRVGLKSTNELHRWRLRPRKADCQVYVACWCRCVTVTGLRVPLVLSLESAKANNGVMQGGGRSLSLEGIRVPRVQG